ncbi:universal stress protein [Candidatus Bathyarchaeota archaeon]|nr:MAG: universal stress protein [Candidatus Bathyarchaeota archaeon]
MQYPLFKKILVPLDGSEHSLRALEIAVQIAKKFEAKITLIHVYSVGIRPVVMPEPTTLTPIGVPVMAPTDVSKVAEATRKAGAAILADGEEKVKAEGIEDVETLLKEGHSVQEIVKTAKEGSFDLIVIGARGISKIREIILGSVSDGVVHNAPCPVLVVK